MTIARTTHFWLVFILCNVTTSFAQQEQVFRVEQAKSYMLIAEQLQLAAEQGQPEAITRLAEMYERGLGIPQNIYKALNLYRKAASLGFESAQLRLESLGANALAEPKKELDEEVKTVETKVTRTTHITINVRNVTLSRPVFDVWSSNRIAATRTDMGERLVRRRPFMSIQRQPNRRFLSSSQASFDQFK